MTKKFHPDVLHIIYSLKCNLRCRHCHNDSSGEQTKTIDINDIVNIISSAKNTSIERVVLLGGEIFLYPDIVRTIIKHTHANDMRISIVTNGFWGKSIDSVTRILDLLVESDWNPETDKIVCSAGDYHQEWMPLESIKTVITKYYTKFKKPVNIQVECITTTLEDFKKELSSIPHDKFEITKVFHGTNLYRYGREQSLVVDNSKLKSYKSIPGCTMIDRLMIEPNGAVFPCHGFNDHNPGLSFGRIDSFTSAANMIQKANESFIIKLLSNTELREVYSVILSNHPYLPDKFATICEMCEIVCDNRYRKELEDAYPELR